MSTCRTTSGVPVPLRRVRVTTLLAAVSIAAVCGSVVCAQVTAPAPSAPAAEEPAASAPEKLKLTTSDDFTVAAWYYPAATPDAEADAGPPAPAAIAIVIHDLGGSHESVEPLARELQARGIAVVAPDLRGHGATTGPEGRALDAKSLKKSDFDSMAMTAGGRVREQAAKYGDIEAVRNWIARQAEAKNLDLERLVVVGAGLGGAVAAQWTILDAAWPDLASGRQGRQVRGLVLISPTWTTRGFSISPALAAEPVRRSLPVLVIAGTQDADAVKIYDQLKRQRPDSWNEKRGGQAAPTQAPKLAANALPTLYLRQFETGLTGDRLAGYVPKDRRGAGHPSAIVEGFIGAVTAAEE